MLEREARRMNYPKDQEEAVSDLGNKSKGHKDMQQDDQYFNPPQKITFELCKVSVYCAYMIMK